MDLSDYHIEKLDQKLNDITRHKYQLNRIQLILNLLNTVKNSNPQNFNAQFPNFIVKIKKKKKNNNNLLDQILQFK